MSDYYTQATEVSALFSTVEAQEYLRVDSETDRDLITALVLAATIQGEKHTNRAFTKRVFTGFFSEFKTTQNERFAYIDLRRAPLKALNSVKVVLNDVLTDVDAGDYQLKETSTFARLLFLSSITADDVPYPIQVNFDAGYKDLSIGDSKAPNDIETAIKQHLAFFYENRGDVMPEGKVGMPVEVQAIYSKYRILNTYG